MEILHDKERHRFSTSADGKTGYVTYDIHDGGLDIRHTVVPEEIGGRGIASALVKAAYDYARGKGLACIATCRYAAVWLERHPIPRDQEPGLVRRRKLRLVIPSEPDTA